MVDSIPSSVVDNGCASQPQCSQNLTQAEREVLTLLTKEFLTQAQIARRRSCSRQAVNKLIQGIKQKGFLGTGLTSMVDTICTQPDAVNLEQVKFPIRLHGEEWNLQIINISEVMLGEMRILLQNNAFGMVHVDVTNAKPQYKHALNFFIDHQGNWWYYEPQTGEIFRNPFYKPYFFYV